MQTTHHRIVCVNLDNSNVLHDVMRSLCADSTEVPTVYDLVIDDRDDFSLDTVIRDMFPVCLLPEDEDTPWFVPIAELATKLGEECARSGYIPQTKLFLPEFWESSNGSEDIDHMQLFDLLMALAGDHYKVIGIYSQWTAPMFQVMDMSKGEEHAKLEEPIAGGRRITMPNFSVPCFTHPDRAETVIRTLAKHEPSQVGDYFVNEFVNPILDCVPEGPMSAAVESALMRFVGQTA